MLRQKFNDGWEVKSKLVSMIESFENHGEDQNAVELPHDAMIHEERTPDTKNRNQTGFYPGGLYTYTRKLDVPHEWERKTLFMEFEGVSNYPKVYVNGDYAGGCRNGYSNFYISLGQFLKYGEMNEIRVVADNMEETSRWYCGGGIYKDVNLLVGGEIYFEADSLKVSAPDISETEAVIAVEISLCNQGRRNPKVWIETVICDGMGEEIAKSKIPVTAFAGESLISRQRIPICEPRLWSAEHPTLYTCSVRAVCDEEVLDEDRTVFGIRRLELSAQTGLRVNGQEVKLRGACIHLDNGILGAAAYPDADERKIRLLKEAGFNCIRSSHQPIGKTMLEVCDRLGMYVMDEFSDVWTRQKNVHDYSTVFEDTWEEDVKRMVEKDFNHPSVILYSTGNEIQEAGSAKGAQTNRRINEKIKQLDDTRYTVSAVNGMLAGQARLGEILAQAMGISQEELATSMAAGQEGAGQADTEPASAGNENGGTDTEQTSAGNEGGGADALNGMMSVMTGPLADAIATSPILAEMIEEYVSVTDIAGYNYLTALHEAEKERHPNRVVLGTETFPADIVRLWNIVKSNPHVIGDMTWTGYDYLGEAGCGIFHYDGTENFTSHWPDRTAYIGDLDLNGYRRPISYFREIVYGLRKEPYIAVRRVNRNGQKPSVTPWMWKDNIASWTWPGYEGESASVDVYADADEVELFLNGNSCGKKSVKGTFEAVYDIPYQPGCLMAVAYTDGRETGRFCLDTANDSVELEARADKAKLSAARRELAFITVVLKDGEGHENLFQKKRVSVHVEGAAELLGFGNADPQAMGSYDDTEWETYDGQVMAVIRAGREPGMAKIVFSAEDCKDQTVEFEVI